MCRNSDVLAPVWDHFESITTTNDQDMKDSSLHVMPLTECMVAMETVGFPSPHHALAIYAARSIN